MPNFCDGDLDIGDTVLWTEEDNPDFENAVECIVAEIVGECVTKLRAVYPDESLGKRGFFQEGEEWVLLAVDISKN